MLQYKNNYLKSVIFQINYIPIEQLNTGLDFSLSEFIEKKIGVKIKETKNININITQEKSTTNQFSQWNFLGKTVQLVINNSFFQINTAHYTNYQEFHPVIIDIYNEFEKIYKPAITRIALRYINTISLNDGATFDFNDIINDNLLNPTIAFKEDGLSRSIGIMNINNGEGIYTNFLYGFHNSEYPNKISKREFVLDYDCFSNSFDVTKDKIDFVLQDLRERVNSLFEKSIGNKLRKMMNQ